MTWSFLEVAPSMASACHTKPRASCTCREVATKGAGFEGRQPGNGGKPCQHIAT